MRTEFDLTTVLTTVFSSVLVLISLWKFCREMMVSWIIGGWEMTEISTLTSDKTVVFWVILSTIEMVSIPVLFLHLDLTICSQQATYYLFWIPTGSHSWLLMT